MNSMELYSCELIKLSEIMPSRDSVHLIFFFLKGIDVKLHTKLEEKEKNVRMLSSFLLRKVSQKDIHESRKDEPRVLSLKWPSE